MRRRERVRWTPHRDDEHAPQQPGAGGVPCAMLTQLILGRGGGSLRGSLDTSISQPRSNFVGRLRQNVSGRRFCNEIKSRSRSSPSIPLNCDFDSFGDIGTPSAVAFRWEELDFEQFVHFLCQELRFCVLFYNSKFLNSWFITAPLLGRFANDLVVKRGRGRGLQRNA